MLVVYAYSRKQLWKSFLHFIGKDWDKIIPETDRRKIEEEERQQQLLEMNLGPRNRKTIQQVTGSVFPMNFLHIDKSLPKEV